MPSAAPSHVGRSCLLRRLARTEMGEDFSEIWDETCQRRVLQNPEDVILKHNHHERAMIYVSTIYTLGPNSIQRCIRQPSTRTRYSYILRLIVFPCLFKFLPSFCQWFNFMFFALAITAFKSILSCPKLTSKSKKQELTKFNLSSLLWMTLCCFDVSCFKQPVQVLQVGLHGTTCLRHITHKRKCVHHDLWKRKRLSLDLPHPITHNEHHESATTKIFFVCNQQQTTVGSVSRKKVSSTHGFFEQRSNY